MMHDTFLLAQDAAAFGSAQKMFFISIAVAVVGGVIIVAAIVSAMKKK